MHAMTSSAFAPNKRQTRREGFSNKLGQLASYMDDHYSRYGLFTIYEYTWFVKRHDDTHFLMSPPISVTALCSQCYSAIMFLFATAIRASDDKGSYYGVQYGRKLTFRRYTPSLPGGYMRRIADYNRIAKAHAYTWPTE
ncbi:hypothetical protein M752DRAFT_266153 [Aspergillus phoenicis ATCC 13157]|uniref:Uncharacterized protein n=1 Tax=Aspergillus phoenicis ATCC 13157 TaxID=1353007 RepID=A0A370PJG3_ASPPH|nr:hypothetical protein M752DRAFT_266153 [Aspergillus phoenicis ATCC 13157]